MKVFDIALKDLTRSFRSTFAVVFMLGVPLLVTGMFYFMFGNIKHLGRRQISTQGRRHNGISGNIKTFNYRIINIFR